ncbi:MAG TPA: hypothetical protein VLJ12_00855 [Burkholderiales bacterium]|nr:hypothetical protein [Burkholderiales bacterium]
MTTPTLEDFRRNPELRSQLVQAAHRQRNEAIGRLFARLYKLLKRGADEHGARPDLASQG